MPKSRQRKKKNPSVQVIREPEFLNKEYKGLSMKVKNPKYGKLKTIVHAPEQPSSSISEGGELS